MFKGAITALVTPFAGGRVDENSLADLIETQISAGIDGLSPCGTTGEAATLSYEEHKRVVAFAVEVAAGRAPVVAGAGSNNTAEAIALTLHAKHAGADAALHIAPYYNRPTQEGLYQHFAAVAEATDFPLVIYNIMSRTGVNITPATMARLAGIPQVAAVKEASGNVQQMAEIKLLCGDKIDLLSGDDTLTLPVLAIGGSGVVSVLSNLLPRQTADMCRLWREGEIGEAREIYYRYLPLCRDLFIETNPIMIKTALYLAGLIKSPELRLPMCGPERESRDRLAAALSHYGLLAEA
ncbi:MAG: 4-hydroxy-tetrahydrodipicolinate synthase [Desulfarculales bacterium]|jgi:4-hydroxy-tetrahydrodipicolinate synthase|nr:4-hydroxy-tetrahydrodipicolinate synthase [Desulfarculales bacterium]